MGRLVLLFAVLLIGGCSAAPGLTRLRPLPCRCVHATPRIYRPVTRYLLGIDRRSPRQHRTTRAPAVDELSG